MTTIQIFALIGVFLIGTIAGNYAMLQFVKLAIRYSTVVGMEVGTCEDPECHRMHLRIHTFNATKSLGINTTTIGVDPGIANILLTAFKSAESPPPIPPPPPPIRTV
jgi:hypothetical protein